MSIYARSGRLGLDVAAHVHVPVQDADDLHHVRAHPIEHHMRADGGLAVSGPDVFGRPAGQGAVAQRLAGITDVPRVALSANMPETPAPRGISVGRGGENR